MKKLLCWILILLFLLPSMGAVADTPLSMENAYQELYYLNPEETVYREIHSRAFEREQGFVAPDPDNYMHYPMGVITFRGDNFRRNAAFGTAKIENENMYVLWNYPINSLDTEEDLLHGWSGQPAIIRWTVEVRQGMNLYEEKSNKFFTEVIFGGLDGKIHFLDLNDGTPSRDPIDVGYPLTGSVSVSCMGLPLLAVGYGNPKTGNDTTNSAGSLLYNLVTGKEAYRLNGKHNIMAPMSRPPAKNNW